MKRQLRSNLNRFVIVITVLSTMLLTACSNKEPEVLRIGSMPTLSATIYAVGVEQGFFAEEGLDVELTIFRSSIERDAAATSGNLDGFMTDMMGAVTLYDKGFKFVMTSAEYEDFGIVTRKDITKNTLQSGAKVGMSNNTIIEYVMDTYLVGDHEKVNIMAVPDRLGALLSGELDMGIFPQPFIGIVLATGGTQIVSTAQNDLQPVVVVFDKALVMDNKNKVEAFYKGYEKAVAYMKNNEFDAYKNVMVKYGLATEETVDKMKLPLDKFDLHGPDQTAYEAITAWMRNEGVLENVPAFDDISVTTFVTK